MQRSGPVPRIVLPRPPQVIPRRVDAVGSACRPAVPDALDHSPRSDDQSCKIDAATR